MNKRFKPQYLPYNYDARALVQTLGQVELQATTASFLFKSNAQLAVTS